MIYAKIMLLFFFFGGGGGGGVLGGWGFVLVHHFQVCSLII